MRLLDCVQAQAALTIGRSSSDKPEADNGEGQENGRQGQEVLNRNPVRGDSRRSPRPEPGTELEPEMI